MASIGDPRSWYPVALARDLGPRPLSISVFERDFVLFRGAGGAPAAVGRYCKHMGADLSLAQVTQEGLRCRLHGWEYDPDGLCRRIPGAVAPDGANLSRIACIEFGGIVFVWPGSEPEWPFPDVVGLRNLRAARPRTLEIDCPFMAIGLNGFDVWHFDTVHHRQVLSKPLLRSLAPEHLGISLTAAVRRGRLYDNLLIALGYETLRVQFDYWGGNLVFVRNMSGGYVAMIAMTSTTADSCRVYMTVLNEACEGCIGYALQSMRLEIYRVVAWQFVKLDVPVVSGMRPQQGHFIPGRDDAAKVFCEWWRALPRIGVLPT